MKTNRIAPAAAALLAAFTTTALAADVTLKVGDPAPALQIAKFVQGEPVKEFSRDHAYIVEFWATWCGPCIVSIPHVNELHNKFKDKGLIVIGQDCWERDESAVEPFLKKMGDKMTYRVALDLKTDDKDRGRMATTWMQAAGQNGIPAAFVVNKEGRIAWIGHPMTLKESLLEQVLAGTFDIAKAAAAHELRIKNEPAQRAASLKLNQAMRAKNWSDADAALTELEKLLPEEDAPMYGSVRFQVLMGQKRADEAMKLARRLSDKDKDNVSLNNSLAWTIVSQENPSKADLELAAVFANRANDAAEGKNPSILDTLARVLFQQGKKEQAIALQEKAVDLAQGTLQKRMKDVLAGYREGKLPPAR